MSNNQNHSIVTNSIDFLRLVAQEAQYNNISVSSELMPRLKEACEGVDDIKFDIRFFTDPQGLKSLSGNIRAKATLICQRCNNPYEELIVSQFESTSDYELAKSLRIEDKLDFIELDDNGKFDLLNYLEDCLILSLPTVPYHADDDESCQRRGDFWSYGDNVQVENPFAALKDLKSLKDKFK